jgi:hypothetical protein
MKNDWVLQYMGCSRTKDKDRLKISGLEKYKNLEKVK